ncbi:hypothetical protein FB45DRAFT_999506 [Roridomyces roridus]|uniref:F-box domain-containing protein n=1 Tax=Roridomyces roridus TaxID=1738132 RepID=A0AAD7FYQ6_9AGAR|nr:hypothetical protein FB45DRAFT_999506 [Roridomyces roridus]
MSAIKLRARLAEIEQRMLALQAQMVLLHAVHQSVRNDLDAIVYPVLQLPNEITSEIFTRYVEDKDSKDSSPLRLLEICRSWREVAISTCQLWTHIRSVQLLAYWLPRAGGIPLDVKLVLRDTPETLAALQMLCQYSSQWERVELRWAGNGPLPTVFSGPFPNLKKFTLTAKMTLPPLLADAPHLQELELGYGSLASEWNSTPSLMHITRLNLTFETEKCFQLLAQAPNVEDLCIATPYGVANPEPDTPPTTSLILPRVHTLRFAVPSASQILEYLTLPALENLSIALGDSGEWDPTPDLVQLLERSGCTLRKLNLQLIDAHQDSLDSFIELVPLQATRDLTLSNPDGQKLDFDDLLGAMIKGTLLPALDSLKIVGYQFGDGLTSLIALISARADPASWQDVAKLKSVGLSFAAGITAGPVIIPHELFVRTRRRAIPNFFVRTLL